MLSLIKIEWLKIKKYPAFWWILGIVALTYPGVNLMFHSIYEDVIGRKDMAGNLAKMLLGNPYAFPEVWHSVAYFSSWFLMVPAILVIMLISNEYTFKTNRQNVIDGWSKNEFILSKLFDVLIVSIVATIAYVIIAASFGFAYSSEFEVSRWSEQLKYVPLFLLQTFSQLSIAFLLGFLFKRSFISLGIFLFYFAVVEPLLTLWIGHHKMFTGMHQIANFFPLEISDKLIPSPAFIGKIDKDSYARNLNDINIHILYTCLLTAVIWWLCFITYRKRDI